MLLIELLFKGEALSFSLNRFATKAFGIGTAVPTATMYATTDDFSERLRELTLLAASWLCASRILDATSVGTSTGAGGTKNCNPFGIVECTLAETLDGGITKDIFDGAIEGSLSLSDNDVAFAFRITEYELPVTVVASGVLLAATFAFASGALATLMRFGGSGWISPFVCFRFVPGQDVSRFTLTEPTGVESDWTFFCLSSSSIGVQLWAWVSGRRFCCAHC